MRERARQGHKACEREPGSEIKSVRERDQGDKACVREPGREIKPVREPGRDIKPVRESQAGR